MLRLSASIDQRHCRLVAAQPCGRANKIGADSFQAVDPNLVRGFRRGARASQMSHDAEDGAKRCSPDPGLQSQHLLPLSIPISVAVAVRRHAKRGAPPWYGILQTSFLARVADTSPRCPRQLTVAKIMHSEPTPRRVAGHALTLYRRLFGCQAFQTAQKRFLSHAVNSRILNSIVSTERGTHCLRHHRGS